MAAMRRVVPLAMRMAAAMASQRGGIIANQRCYHHLQQASPIESTSFREGIVRKELTRGYASKSKATSEEFIRPPMDIPTLPGKYASIVFVEAAKLGILEQVESELREVGQAIIHSPDFAAFLKDVSIPKHTASQRITDVFGKTNFTDLTKTFLAGVARNGRLKHLKAMTEAFEELMKAKRGHVTVCITSAAELTPDELESLKSRYVSQLIKPSETPTFECKIDEGILGGVIIEVRDKRLDLSVDRRIRDIEKVLLSAV